MMGPLEPRSNIEIALAVGATGFRIRVLDRLDGKVASLREIGLAILAAKIAAARPLARPGTFATQPFF
jgi:hypothetical protein